MTRHSNEEVLLRIIHCKWCSLIFTVCRSCYCGQVYCCGQCREIARRVACRKAQSKYRTSPEGRETNRLAARRRRIQSYQKTVADHTTTPVTIRDIILPKTFVKESCCSFCGTPGTVVERFPSRGYGRVALLNSNHSKKPPPCF